MRQETFFARKKHANAITRLQNKNQICKAFNNNVEDFSSIEDANKWLIKNNFIEPIDVDSAWVDNVGYLTVYAVGHPLSPKSGKVYIHRYNVCLKIGRYLKTHEHVHHVDHNKLNNDPLNLKIITNSEHQRLHRPYNPTPTVCEHCGVVFDKTDFRNNKSFCSTKCDDQSRKKFDPTKEELQDLIWKLSTVKIAALYGVSDKAVEKRCKKLGIDKPPRGYWAKQYSQNE